MVKKRSATGRAPAATAAGGSDTDDDEHLRGGGGGRSIPEDAEVGFAKLQGEDFEYYMQTYSIVLGRNSKNSEVDVDLASLGGGMSISRRHARIFYDFPRRRFALEVLGKNGCLVEGVLYVPGTPPVKLDSQDLIQMGDKQFYFLLPRRSIFGGVIPRQPAGGAPVPYGGRAGPSGYGRLVEQDVHEENIDVDEDEVEETDKEEEEEEEEEEEQEQEQEEENHVGSAATAAPGKRPRRDVVGEVRDGIGMAGKAGPSGRLVKKSEVRTKADREADNQQLLQLEEEDVISSVAILLSDLCPPGEWLSMAKLHEEALVQYGTMWHHGRVRKYLTSEDWPKSETKGRPWFGLLMLLRKYPEHFAITIQPKGRATMEFVSLVA